ncbi:MAG TPA: peptide deformylase [Actinomycetota bacterium]|nr:peptide deformylase [Actinomycetota bacterium]
MAVLPIRTFGDPVLRRRASEVSVVDEAVRKLMHDMSDTVIDAPGVGLAAPQIGVPRRVIVWTYEGEGGALANPVIVEQHGHDEADEACLSLPGLSYPVPRALKVRVMGLNDRGERIEREFTDWTARIMQHEIDHLDGVLFIDRIAPDLARQARRRLREAALSGVPLEPVAAL